MPLLRDYKDAVEVLKKSYWHTGKIADQNIYEAVVVANAKSRKPGSFSIASVLAILVIRRYDYYY